MNGKESRLHWIGLAAIACAAAVRALTPRFDPDFWWHLRNGRLIMETGRVPHQDLFSFTAAGSRWIDHEWLTEVAMQALWLRGGPILLLVIASVLTTLVLLLVYATSLRRGARPLPALITLALAAVASMGSIGPRVQMVTLLFSALFAFILAGRRGRSLYLLPPMILLWANLHGGFVIGLLLMALAMTGEALEGRWSAARRLCILFLVSLGVTFLNPNGAGQLLYPLRFVVPNAFTARIQEAASPNFHLPVVAGFEVLLLLLLLAAALRARSRLDFGSILAVAAFVHLALSATRNVALAAVILAPITADLMSRADLNFASAGELSGWTRPLSRRMTAILDGSILLATTVALGLLARDELSGGSLRSIEADYPAAAVARVAGQGTPARVFTEYHWGGYLLWRAPEARVFIDARADTVYSEEILRQYLRAGGGGVGWKGILQRWHVDTVIVEPDAPLAQLLAADPEWHLVLRDAKSIMYQLNI
jgi:hypothetical protein